MNDIENDTMREEQTNKLRSMLTNLMHEENSKEQESNDLLLSELPPDPDSLGLLRNTNLLLDSNRESARLGDRFSS